jgi:hypothetical protein
MEASDQELAPMPKTKAPKDASAPSSTGMSRKDQHADNESSDDVYSQTQDRQFYRRGRVPQAIEGSHQHGTNGTDIEAKTSIATLEASTIREIRALTHPKMRGVPHVNDAGKVCYSWTLPKESATRQQFQAFRFDNPSRSINSQDVIRYLNLGGMDSPTEKSLKQFFKSRIHAETDSLTWKGIPLELAKKSCKCSWLC